MIKINLIHSKTGNSSKSESSSSDMDFNFDPVENSDKKAGINFLIITIFPALVWFYGYTQFEKNKNFHEKVVQEYNAKLSEEEQLNIQKTQRKELIKEVKEVERKVATLKGITRNRLNEIKALDAIQTVMPDRLWLNSIDYENKIFVFKGATIVKKSIGDFVKNLEKRQAFDSVVQNSLKEKSTPSGTEYEFELSAKLREGV